MSVVLQPPDIRIANIVRLIDAEFDEMPGMRLTGAQIRRLWNVSERESEEALEYLCDEGRLVRDASGRYVRHVDDY